MTKKPAARVRKASQLGAGIPKKYMRQSVVKRLVFITCAVVLFPSLILSALFYRLYSAQVIGSINARLRTALEHSMSNVESELRQVETQALQVFGDMYGETAGSLYAQPDFMELADLLKRIDQVVLSNNGVSKVVYCNRLGGYLLDSLRGYVPRKRFSRDDLLLDGLQTERRSGWYRLDGGDGRELSFVQKLPLYFGNNYSSEDGILQVPFSVLEEDMRELESLHTNGFSLLFADGGRVLYYGGEGIGPGVEQIAIWHAELLRQPGQTGGFEVEDSANGVTYICNYVRSRQGYTLILAATRADLYAQMNTLSLYFSAIVAINILLLLIMGFIYALSVYKPIRNLANRSFEMAGEQADLKQARNEFEYVLNMLTSYSINSVDMRNYVDAIRPRLRSGFVRLLLEGKRSAEIEELAGHFGISPSDRAVAVALVWFPGADGALAAREHGVDGLLAVLDAAADVRHDVSDESDGRLCLVLYFDRLLGPEAIAQTVDGIVVRILRGAALDCGLSVAVGIGNVCDSVHSVGLSYRQALSAANHQAASGLASALRYHDMQRTMTGYYYPLHVEMRLIEALRSGDRDSCLRILSEIFEKNFTGRRVVDPGHANCLFFDVMGTLIKVINDPSLGFAGVRDDERELLDGVLPGDGYQEMYDNVVSMFETVCGHIGDCGVKARDSAIEGILEYIKEGFTSPDLSQSMIAEEFGMSQSALSTYFKKMTGRSMVNHINSLRLDYIKKRLPDKSVHLVELSRQAGFGNVQSMIRIFKSYEGMTPGKYRELLSREEGME